MPKAKKNHQVRKGRKYEKPVSLFGLSFDEAVTRLAKAKPKRLGKKT